ncbi:related to cardiolipin synthase [Cephalotrichum gorgonifer]|uniref:Related to cardiolipin synthase n=1 Tax=Cephalotrichum gorgonifer TaxID=2041049 RepID=A0AAE8MQS4_9PEZI|nr:related to cardiolipin synthase [Cephalotrichum gorgonifer]
MLFLRGPSRPALRALKATRGAAAAVRTSPIACRANACSGIRIRSPSKARFSVLSAVLGKSRDPSAGPPSQSDPPPSAPSAPPAPTPTIHENIYTIPNILTFSRIAASPFIGYFVLHDQHAWALGLLAYAGISDLVDGYIARRWNMRTVVGTIIDPMADKMLMTVLTVSLAAKGALPLWVASVILLRDVGLGISALYYRWISLPAPKTFRRYWDFSLPSAEVKPTTISKYNTALQLALVGLTTAAPVIPFDMSSALPILQYVVAATTVLSGASYVFSKDAVKILNQASKSK